MRKKLLTALFCSVLFITKSHSQALQTFHDFWGITILGDTISFSQWAGKKLLVVNTASYCGYTPQFDDLQALDSTYGAYNFEVIGFPCNDFGHQDPGDDSTINNFCTGIYGVQFQMMSKVFIAVPDTAECYKWLQWQSLNGVADAQVTWNFHKFCIDEAGGWVAHHPSQTLPFDTAIVNWILNTPPVATGIKNDSNADYFTLLKNPTDNGFTIEANLKNAESITVDVIGYNGNIVSSKGFNLNAGINYIEPDAVLTKGVYFIKVNGQNFNRVLKAIKL
ncbi:MAG TPA: T9SS type A sorting domain-containing protein [Bacteroidia bacterium]|nr:T9SS type A sorting domain-containing protein [Bacteroidia bacterium]HNU33577.1 T9SS type A sorting domain-containing protein [Bacteroidia bacterium]